LGITDVTKKSVRVTNSIPVFFESSDITEFSPHGFPRPAQLVGHEGGATKRSNGWD